MITSQASNGGQAATDGQATTETQLTGLFALDDAAAGATVAAWCPLILATVS